MHICICLLPCGLFALAVVSHSIMFTRLLSAQSKTLSKESVSSGRGPSLCARHATDDRTWAGGDLPRCASLGIGVLHVFLGCTMRPCCVAYKEALREVERHMVSARLL